ncbi:MAG: hypothetical protein GY720_16425, partial [bacterium]|nr:hypothetical protein [bacterium]
MSGAIAVDAASGSPLGPVPLDTTEVRWFADGVLPFSLVEAFYNSAGPVNIEVRCDTYHVGGSIDVGLKRRGGGRVEIKTRLSSGGLVGLGGAVPGRIEEWRKTAGLEAPAAPQGEGEVWSEVNKVVLKCTYGAGANHVGGSGERRPATSGCHIELASVLVEDIQAWTFALEAWGPAAVRRKLLAGALAALNRDSPLGPEFEASLEHSMGYPEWL